MLIFRKLLLLGISLLLIALVGSLAAEEPTEESNLLFDHAPMQEADEVGISA